MAKKFIDAAVTDSRDDMTVSDGTSLTLTNAVRILYDNTVTKSDLLILVDRIRDKIRQDLG